MCSSSLAQPHIIAMLNRYYSHRSPSIARELIMGPSEVFGLADENMEHEKTNYTLKLILRGAAKSFWDS